MTGMNGMDGTDGANRGNSDGFEPNYLSLKQFAKKAGVCTTTARDQFLLPRIIEGTNIGTKSRPRWQIHVSQLDVFDDYMNDLREKQYREEDDEFEKMKAESIAQIAARRRDK